MQQVLMAVVAEAVSRHHKWDASSATFCRLLLSVIIRIPQEDTQVATLTPPSSLSVIINIYYFVKKWRKTNTNATKWDKPECYSYTTAHTVCNKNQLKMKTSHWDKPSWAREDTRDCWGSEPAYSHTPPHEHCTHIYCNCHITAVTQ